MKYVDEYRNPESARRLVARIAQITTQPWSLMEICGGQTHSIIRHGIDQLLPEGLELLHGPGCPVCVTPASVIDTAIAIAQRRHVILCSFGDMLRVPGHSGSLLQAKARGAGIHMVYSPLDALSLARREPEREVVFFAVGFETTAPATAMAILQADRDRIANFSVLVSHVLVPPAIRTLLDGDDNHINGFLAAGHVCTVMGYQEYEPIARRYGIPIVVTGFEPLDLLQGIYECVRQLEAGEARVKNQYRRSVCFEGNEVAQRAMSRVFKVASCKWRGLGEIAESGLRVGDDYRRFDALDRFPEISASEEVAGQCVSAEILMGRRKPPDCPAFATQCSPDHPLGATMVSSEGACAAYYRYRRMARSRPTEIDP